MSFVRAGATPRRILQAREWICLSCQRQARRNASRTQRTQAASLRHPGSYIQRRERESHTTETNGHRSFPETGLKSSKVPILPNGPARTRFAPSPTGFLHIGGLRTALFSYLLARRTGGRFILRIEDTDQKRLVPGAEERLLHDLRWAGLQWDEGPEVGGPFGPYAQSQRNEIYQKHARDLLDRGAAYRCFCTPQTAGQGSLAYVTSGCYQDCAALPTEQSQKRAEDPREAFTVRLSPLPERKGRVYPDLVYGKITPPKRSPTPVAHDEDDSGIDAADIILMKSNGTPTYHFANVVDDHLMRITHVIRGTEWMASTPLHYDLYEAFGWTPPAFAHVGLLVDENQAKLSKRSDDLAWDVKSMREDLVILPETLCNFLVLLGWSTTGHSDVYAMLDLVEKFDLKFTRGNTMVQPEKLWYLQKHHVTRRCEKAREANSIEPIRELVERIRQEAKLRFPAFAARFKTEDEQLECCAMVLLANDKSYQNAQQHVERNRYFFAFDASQIPEERESYGKHVRITPRDLKTLAKSLMAIDLGQTPPRVTTSGAVDDQERRILSISASIHDAIDDVLSSKIQPSPGLELAAVRKDWSSAIMRYLREKLSYGLPGTSIAVLMAILGHRECCRRLGVDAEGAEAAW